jgi:hypothetical protein
MVVVDPYLLADGVHVALREETLSSTNRFNLCQWAACGTTIKSVI